MKFSIIVPVYNVEKYIKKCLDSILNQTYTNFEVIIINDGTKDGSQEIINEYTFDERFQSYEKENGGLSSARNYGLKYVTGDYILFVDSDDYIDENLLLKLNETLTKNKVDLVRFSCALCDEENNVTQTYEEKGYTNVNIEDIIKELVTRSFVEPVWLYCYNANFFKSHNFKYEVSRLHEDYGLTPLILYYCNKITCISYTGYYYRQRSGSITKDLNYSKIKKMADDIYYQYTKIMNIFDKEVKSLKKDVIMSYMTECLFFKSKYLNKEDYKTYKKNLKEINAFNRIKPYNFKKLVKKIISKISLRLYTKIF